MQRFCAGFLTALFSTFFLPPSVAAQVIVGPGPGSADTELQLIDSAGTRTVSMFFPPFIGAVRATLGDVNGDGVVDIIGGAGPGGGPHVRVLSGTDLSELASFYAFDPRFTGGVHVASGDVDGDGRADVIVGADAGGGPHVRVFSGRDLSELASFYAYDPAFRGGVFVAAGDIDGDGLADIVTGAGAGGGPHVRVFSGADLSELASFFAYDATFPGGVSVAAGDVNGDGLSDIITGAGAGGGPHVRVFSGDDLSELAGFYAFEPSFAGGVNVASGDYDGDGRVDLILGAGPGGGPHVVVVSGLDFSELDNFFVAGMTGSISIGSVGDSPGLRFTSATATTFTVGSAGTFTVTTAGEPPPAITAIGALPDGVTFVDNGNGTATLAGMPGSGSGNDYVLTFTADNGTATPRTQTFTLTVNQPPAITSAAATTFTAGAAGTFAVTTTGFPRPTITRTGGALPDGVTWVDNGDGTGTLSGTPDISAAGPHAITFTADNGVGPAAAQSFTLTVSGAPTFTSAAATTFAVGSLGTFTVTTVATPAVTTILRSGTLPGGVNFVDNHDGTGTLSGTPATGTGGVYNLTFTVNNGIGGDVVQNFTLTVAVAPVFTSANATTFTVGSAGTFMVTTAAQPGVTTITRGGAALPTGVNFTNNGDGTATLNGTPATNTGGTYALTFTANNGIGGNVVQNFTLTINEPPIITSANSATFTLNTPGTTFQVTMTGIPAPTVAITAGTPPNGLGLSAAGLLAGTPTQSGSFPVTLTATNGTLPNATQAFTIVVNEAPAITSASSTIFTVGTPGTFTVTTTGSPTPAVSQTGTLPAGVTFDTATRVLAGPATQTGLFPLVFTAANGVSPNATQNFTLNVVCPAITVTPLVMPDGLYQTVYAGVDFNQTGSTGTTFTWGAVGLPAGLTIDVNTGVVSGTATNTVLAGGVTVTVTDNFGCQGTLGTAVTIRPTTDNENYLGGVGNTQYVTGAPFPLTPHVAFVDDVKTGDAGPGALSVTFPATSTNGGTIVEGTGDGTFTYTPAVAFAGPTDTFTYTLTDGNGVTNTGTVTINLSNVVWYVNSAGGAGDGRSHNPFNTLNAAATPSGSTHIIYVHSGGATTTGNLAMDANQTVHGQGATFTLNGLTIGAGTRPTLTGTVTLADNTTVRAVNFTPGAIPAMTASGVSFAQPVTIDQVNVTGGTSALSLTNVTATATGAINVSNAAFTNTSAAEVLISQGTIPVTLATTATISSNAGRSVDIQNRTAGTIVFNGAITDTGQGIFLNANTGATITFNGGLALSTGTSPAFTATGGGTISTTQNNTTIVNTLTTTTGTALNMANTTIRASGLTFRSISSNGATKGIILNNTGALAGLTVTGTGAAGSGGTIANATSRGGEFISTSSLVLSDMNFTNNGIGGAVGSCGDALGATTTGTFVTAAGCLSNIHLESVTTATLTRVTANDGDGHGISGYQVSNLTLSGVTVERNGNEVGEDGVQLVNSTGTVTVNGTNTFRDNASNQFEAQNGSGTSTFTISGSFFGLTNFPTTGTAEAPSPGASTANSGLLISGSGTASMTVNVTGSTFEENYANGYLSDTAGSATMNITLGTAASGNAFTSNGVPIEIVNASTGSMTYSIRNNVLTNDTVATGAFATTAITAARSGTGSTMTGTIDGNTIGTPGTANSGCFVSLCDGISLPDSATSSTNVYHVTVTNNQINHVHSGISSNIGGISGGQPRTSFVITGNLVQNPFAGTQGNGILINSGTLPDNVPQTCAEVSGNTMNGAWSSLNDDSIRYRHRGAAGSIFRVRNFTTGNDIDAFVTGINTAGPGTVDLFGFQLVGTNAFTGGTAACPQ